MIFFSFFFRCIEIEAHTYASMCGNRLSDYVREYTLACFEMKVVLHNLELEEQ